MIEEQEPEDMDVDDPDLNPTNTPAARSHETDDPMAVDNRDHAVDLDIAAKPWWDSQCPEPPMPMSGTPYAHMLLDPSSLESDLETNDPVIVVCRRCRSDLKSGRVPPLNCESQLSRACSSSSSRFDGP
jgi:hypothetical protein